jgi:DNA-binding LytR/AlgR family response regulator
MKPDNSIQVLIIEDEQIWSNELSLMLTEMGFTIAGIADCVEDALTAIRNGQFDIVLLDIHLHQKESGIELGKWLFEIYRKPFIFITGSDFHSWSEAVKANPSAYLTKPVSKSALFITIQTAINNFNNKQVAQTAEGQSAPLSHFFVKHGNGFKRMEWDDVLYLVSERNYTRAIIKNDTNGYLFRSSLQKTLSQIMPLHIRSGFVQVNRSEVVNISTIEQLSTTEVSTHFGKFSVGDAYMDGVKKQLNVVT